MRCSSLISHGQHSHDLVKKCGSLLSLGQALRTLVTKAATALVETVDWGGVGQEKSLSECHRDMRSACDVTWKGGQAPLWFHAVTRKWAVKEVKACMTVGTAAGL